MATGLASPPATRAGRALKRTSIVSLKLAKEDRGVKRNLKRDLRTLEVANGTWPGFTTSEVMAALFNLNSSKAVGPDKVDTRLFCYLDFYLRVIFKKSRELTSVPQGWRVADIRIVSKNGKDPQTLDIYYPIFFNSTIRKVMEHLVTNGICYEAETCHVSCENQAGSCRGHGTEDQLVRFSQSISDSFPYSPMKRNVLTLINALESVAP